ncbi:MAG TPA: antibiotic biosynthesis monooxygenase family protein [Jatrophihabitantaceae bacterium]|nr:antibiotic biosynthesis monooxygenase family protein [Jatrophihabitantaceae bacterium]
MAERDQMEVSTDADSTSVVLIVRFRPKPGQREQFLKHLLELVDTMSKEAAFVDTVIHDDIEQPTDIVLYETWSCSRDTWIAEERTRPYRAGYERIAAQLLESRQVNWLIPVRSFNRGS